MVAGVHGPLMVLRPSLVFVQPWQQMVASAILIAIGVILLALSSWAGVLPMAFGLVIAAQLLLSRRPSPADDDLPPPVDGSVLDH
jgi:hypothetical protein